MLPSSAAVSLSITILGLLSLAAFVWAWRSGQFDDIERQGMIPLDDGDLATFRPWETPSQRAHRVEEFGPPRPAAPGAWGGTA
jgi:cbb3-type cytochrome oxidase maturation protein